MIRARNRGRAALRVALALVAAAGCEGGESAAPPGEPGRVVVEVVDGRATLRAQSAPRLILLQRLGRAGGFEVLTAGVGPGLVSVDAEGVSLEEALGLVLQGLPYELRYGVDPASGAHVLEGVSAAGSARLARRSQREGRRALREKLRQQRRAERQEALPPEVRERLEAERQKARAALTARLADPDPAVRGEAVAGLDADAEGVERLAEILLGDPDAGVRVEAAERLAFAESRAAQDALLRALADPEAAVVVAALEALTFAGDASLAPQLRPLLAHPDPAVREQAEHTLGFLE